MFDPLSNFKLNKILSAVNALPTTLASSFTDVKNAISNVKEDTSSSKTTLETLTSTINKEYLLNMNIRQVNMTSGLNGNLVSVTGSGVLLFAEWRNSRANRLTITIDNRTINCTASDSYTELLLVSSQYFSFIPDMSMLGAKANALKLWEGKDISLSGSDSYTVYSPVAIPFNSKFSISHDVYVNSNLLVVYALY